MKCPFCGYSESKVLESRSAEDGAKIRRRRECLGCGKRFTTFEIIETIPLMVLKKDGSIEPFDREKLLGGLIRACQKRPVTIEEMEKIVDEIESELVNSLEREIPSSEIGEMVMIKLRSVDDVAYVRFASVYRQFTDVNSFMDELKTMFKDKKKK